MFYMYVHTQTDDSKSCCSKNHANICSLLKNTFVAGFDRKISPAHFSWCSPSSESGEIRYKFNSTFPKVSVSGAKCHSLPIHFNANAGCILHTRLYGFYEGKCPLQADIHSRASDSCGSVVYSVLEALQSAPALPPSSPGFRGGRRIQARGCSSSWLSLPGPKAEQCRGPAFISARSQLFALHRGEPELHHRLSPTVSILSGQKVALM